MQRLSLSLYVLCFILLFPTIASASSSHDFSYSFVSSYVEACEEDGCAEISAYDKSSSKVFTTNGSDNTLRVLNLSNNGELTEEGAIDLSVYGAAPNSVAVSNGRVAVAVEALTKTDNGYVVVFDSEGDELALIEVGALPDMLIFTPNGKYLLVANEGEPNDDYTVDPEGSISIIDTSDWSVRTADFSAYNNVQLRRVRIFGPGASVAQDLEPEFIAVSENSKLAWVALQENNAFAIVDIKAAKVVDIQGLGYKRHARKRNGLDASNRDAVNGCTFPLNDKQSEECINIQSWPVLGMYQPDAIDSFRKGRFEYIISANEGDARDYDGYSEEVRVGDDEYVLDAKRFPQADLLILESNLGRLKTTTANGDIDGDGDFDRIFSYGARSFSIWNSKGRLVYDSGSEFEYRLAILQAMGMDVWVDDRSDDKGPEPESVVVGQLGSVPLAFIGLERVSGVFVYDLSKPWQPSYVGYINVKAFGDISPEGLIFVQRTRTTGLLLVTNEVSNSVSSYEIIFKRNQW